MISKLKGSKKLDELIKHNKADASIYNTLKENEEAYKDAKKKIKMANKNLENLEKNITSKRKERFHIAFYNIKAQSQLFKEIGELKKQHKQVISELNQLEDVCNEKEELNSKIEKDIEDQYIVYQQNEIFIRAVEKIEKKRIDLSGEFYKRYFKHVNNYLNTVYSIEKETKLKEPNPVDLATLLGALKKDEEINRNKEKVGIKKAAAKKTTTKKVEEKETEQNKTVAKKTAKKVAEVKKAEQKKAAAKKTTKKVAEVKKADPKKSTTRKVEAKKTETKKTTAKKEPTAKTKTTKGTKKVIVLNSAEQKDEIKKTTKKRATKKEVVNQ